MSEVRRGIFTISLDFELAWGFLDWPDIGSYAENLRGGRAAIPLILQRFQQYGVHATWATVGFLLHRDQAEFQASRPEVRPGYEREELDPYAHVERP